MYKNKNSFVVFNNRKFSGHERSELAKQSPTCKEMSKC